MWVGSMMDAQTPSFMRRIDLVVNCTRDIPIAFRQIPSIRVAVDDDPSETENLLAELPRVVAAIDAALLKNKTVFIHCYAGMQRSCAVAAAYLMYVNALYNRSLPAERAMEMVKQRKPVAFEPRPTFHRALRAYQATLK